MLFVQLGLSLILLGACAFVNSWSFPVNNILVIIIAVLLLSFFFFFLQARIFSKAQKSVCISIAAIIVFFFLMNANFYPQLLQYQAGQRLASDTKGKVDPADVYIEKGGNSYSASYTFYANSEFKYFDDSLLGRKKTWLLTEPQQLKRLQAEGYETDTIYTAPHFRVTKLNFKFLDPATRKNELSSMMLVQLVSKKKPDR